MTSVANVIVTEELQKKQRGLWLEKAQEPELHYIPERVNKIRARTILPDEKLVQ